ANQNLGQARRHDPDEPSRKGCGGETAENDRQYVAPELREIDRGEEGGRDADGDEEFGRVGRAHAAPRLIAPRKQGGSDQRSPAPAPDCIQEAPGEAEWCG